MKKETNRPDNRFLSYDVLRIFAAFSVVMLHAAARTWYDLPVTSTNWFIANAYDAAFRFGVPVFVMISGSLFLSSQKELSIKRLYRHNILRMAVIYFLWSAVYGSIGYFRSLSDPFSLKEWIKHILEGRYHLWFLPMIICIYVLIPLLRTWISHAAQSEIRYFLILFFVVQILGTTLLCFVKTPEIIKTFQSFRIELVCGYIGYFVLGYYLKANPLAPKIRSFLYLSTPVWLLANIGISTLQSRSLDIADGSIYDSFGLFTFLIVCALFSFFTTHRFAGLPVSLQNIITGLSKDTLGIYLIHLLFLEWFNPVSALIFRLPTILFVPVLAFYGFFASCICAAVLRRIPILGRYIC